MKRYIFLLIILALVSCSVVAEAEINPESLDKKSAPSSKPTSLASKTAGALIATWDDGKQPLTIRLVEPTTGQDVTGFEPIALPFTHIPAYALSPDGEKLAVIEAYGDACESYYGGETCRENAHVLHLLDLTGGREVTAPLPDQGWVELLAFDPGGQRLALVKHGMYVSTLILFEAGTGQALAQRKLDFRPSHLRYMPDGGSLVLYGQTAGVSPGLKEPDPPHVALIDAGELEVLWEQELAGLVSGMWCVENCSGPHGNPLFVDWSPAVTASADGKLLYIVHADKDLLTTVDFDSRTVHSSEIHARGSFLEHLLSLTVQDAQAMAIASGTEKRAALSLDGEQLYVASRTRELIRGKDGSLESIESQLKFQIIAVADGREVDSQESAIEGEWIEVSDMAFTSDGAFLVANGWSDGDRWAQVFEAQSLKSVALMEGWELALSRSVDGQPVVLANQWKNGQITKLAWLDPRTFEVGGTWQAKFNFAVWLGR